MVATTQGHNRDGGGRRKYICTVWGLICGCSNKKCPKILDPTGICVPHKITSCSLTCFPLPFPFSFHDSSNGVLSSHKHHNNSLCCQMHAMMVISLIHFPLFFFSFFLSIQLWFFCQVLGKFGLFVILPIRVEISPYIYRGHDTGNFRFIITNIQKLIELQLILFYIGLNYKAI